jgi:lipoic acid synthetase
VTISRLDPEAPTADLGAMAVVIDNLGGAIRPRHPEKQANPETPLLRKPEWLRVRAPGSTGYNATREIVKANGLVPCARRPPVPTSGSAGPRATPP